MLFKKLLLFIFLKLQFIQQPAKANNEMKNDDTEDDKFPAHRYCLEYKVKLAGVRML
mgnify:CR=1 FL=1